MMTIHGELILILCLTSMVATLPGTFLVLRGTALLSDVITHCILPGVIILFLFTHNLASPLLFVGATVSGIIAILIAESIMYTKKIQSDAALGLVFPAFFSIGVILINSFAQHTHLDIDMVLLGEIALTPFNRIIIGSFDCGPTAVWTLLTLLILNSIFFVLCYKELTLSIFDPVLAQLMGVSPQLLYYLLMVLTSFTIVGGLQIVGSVVMVAFMIVPPATAQLISSNVKDCIIISGLLSATTSVYGYLFALLFDLSIGGSIALLQGIVFAMTLLLQRHIHLSI